MICFLKKLSPQKLFPYIVLLHFICISLVSYCSENFHLFKEDVSIGLSALLVSLLPILFFTYVIFWYVLLGFIETRKIKYAVSVFLSAGSSFTWFVIFYWDSFIDNIFLVNRGFLLITATFFIIFLLSVSLLVFIDLLDIFRDNKRSSIL